MSAAAPVRRRTVTYADPAPLAVARRASSGLDFFGAIAAGALPQPPIYELLGFRLLAVEPGASRFAASTGEHLFNPFSTVHGGYAATVLDSACGVAVQTRLPQGQGTATIRLEITYLRPILGSMGEVSCRASVVRLGRSVAWSDGEILGPDGKVLVRARGCFAIFPTETGAAQPAPAPVFATRDIAWDDPAPLLAAAARMTGLDFIAGQLDGSLPLPPINHTALYRPSAASPGLADYTCVPETLHYNPMGGVHGGLAAILIDTAGGAAINTRLPFGTAATAVNLSVDYFRPITTATGMLTAAGVAVRVGGRIGVADAEVKDAAGTIYARGTMSYLVYALGGREA